MCSPKVIRSTTIVFLLFAFGAIEATQAQTSSVPSSDCHVTNGQFDNCPNGQVEWSDVKPLFFPVSNSFLYVNQDTTRAFLYLMYDFPFRTSPISAAEAVQVSFDTVEQGAVGASLDHYDISIFGDNHIQVISNGQPETPGRIIGAVAFHASPNSTIPHLVAELQVPLTPGAPTAYSPDPIFWSATVPPTPPPPPPPPGGKTQQQKDALNQAALQLGVQSAASFVAARVICGILTLVNPPAGASCFIIVQSTAEVIALSAAVLALLAQVDPADPNFTVIAQPVTPSLPGQPFGAGNGMTQQEADALNAFLTNVEQSIGLERAAITSLNRATGAQQAGNTFWQNQQIQAAKQYFMQLSSSLTAQPNLSNNLANALQSAGLQGTFSIGDVINFQAALQQTGLPVDVTQALAMLGTDALTMSQITQSLLSKDPVLVNTLGIGTLPRIFSDPSLSVTLQQAGVALSQEAKAFPTSSLSQSLSTTLQGDYSANGVGLRGRTQGTITISGIPVGATIVKAFLYWGMLDNGEDATLKNLTFNGASVTGTNIGSGPDTCWGRTNSFTYRADVTPFVTGNGTHELTGVAIGGSILAEGASLVVIYQLSGAPFKNVMLADGNVVFPAVSSATTSFGGFKAASPVSAKTTFMVGDGQATQFNLFTPVSFTGSLGTLNLTNLFASNNGPLWDTDTFDVSPVIGTDSSSGSAMIRLSGDCLLWSAQALSVTSAPVILSPVIATAAVVKASVSGDTAVNARGLTVSDAPTIQDKIEMIVQSRTIENRSISASDLTTQLVNSIPANILPPSEAANIIQRVLNKIVFPPDSIPPVTSAISSPGPNANGWNNTNVTVSLTSLDNAGGSGVKQITISLAGAQNGTTVVATSTASVALTAEGTTTITYFATDNAGNQEAPRTLTIRIDKTPPTAILSSLPAPNPNGWNNTSVTVTFSGADGLSGIASCSAPITLTTEGAGQSVSGTCIDKAGNVSTPATVKVNIDKTSPSISGLPAPGSCTLWPPDHKLVEVATVTSNDALSGTASFDVTGISNEPPDPDGPDIVITGTGLRARIVQVVAERLGTGSGRIYTLTATATDIAGNTATSTATCLVPHDQGN